MKVLSILLLMLASCFAAQPEVRVQSFPHSAQSTPIGPGLVQGIVGLGISVPGFILPCIECYGAPAGMLVLPPPYQLIRLSQEGQVLLYYYCTVETGSDGGKGIISWAITEATTGKIVQGTSNVPLLLTANSTNLIVVTSGGVTDSDRYNGVEILTFTTTLRDATVQGSLDLFMPY